MPTLNRKRSGGTTVAMHGGLESPVPHGRDTIYRVPTEDLYFTQLKTAIKT
jgi:hypothetical protein